MPGFLERWLVINLVVSVCLRGDIIWLGSLESILVTRLITLIDIYFRSFALDVSLFRGVQEPEPLTWVAIKTLVVALIFYLGPAG